MTKNKKIGVKTRWGHHQRLLSPSWRSDKRLNRTLWPRWWLPAGVLLFSSSATKKIKKKKKDKTLKINILTQKSQFFLLNRSQEKRQMSTTNEATWNEAGSRWHYNRRVKVTQPHLSGSDSIYLFISFPILISIKSLWFNSNSIQGYLKQETKK